MAINKLNTRSIQDTTVSSDDIADSAITNAKVSPSAAIAQSKVSGLSTSLTNLCTSISTTNTNVTALDNKIGSAANNIGLLGFKMAVNDGLTVFNLIDGVVDEFHDESGTDEGEGSNDLYNATDDYYVNSNQPAGVSVCVPYSAGFSMSAVTEADTSTNGISNPAYGEVTEGSSYTVPSCISAVTAHVWGGGGGSSSPNSRSGYGGYARGTIAVTAGQTLQVGIAEGGGTTPQTEGAGGGEGGNSNGRGGSGGMSFVGTTDINALSQPQYGPNQPTVFVVGGGGATATCGGGSDGAGPTGYNGSSAQTNNGPISGGGGDQEQGGQGGSSPDGFPSGQSGAAFKGGASSPQRGTGGGAGYFGGGGGTGQNHTNQSGGGGSSYVGHPQVTSGAMTDARSSPSMYDEPMYPSVSPLGVAGPGSGPAGTAGGDGYVFLIACLSQPASVTSTTIVSNAFAATSVPTTSRIVVFEENVATPTLNTDIIASISRDGGSNFTNATLADSGYVTGSSGQRILTGQATISGQPSGQSMRWKLALANNTVKIHGVALQWS